MQTTTTKTNNDARTGAFDHLLATNAFSAAPLGPESRFFPCDAPKRLQALRGILGAWAPASAAARVTNEALAILEGPRK